MNYQITDFFPTLLQLEHAIKKTDADLTATGEAAAREIKRLDARIDTVQLLPGPQGEPGPTGMDGRDGADGISVVGRDGQPGRDGKDGAPGAPGLVWRGEWKKGSYVPGDAVAWDGSSYICTTPTKAEPGGKGWDVLAMQGERGAKGAKGVTNTYYSRSTTTAPAETVFDNGTIKYNRGVWCPRGTVVRAVGDDGFAVANWNSEEEATVLGITRGDCGQGESTIIQQSGRFELPDLAAWSEFAVGSAGDLSGEVPEGKWRGVVGFSVVGCLIVEPHEPSYRAITPEPTVMAKNVYGPIPALSPVQEDSGEFILADDVVAGFALAASDLGDTIEIRKAGDVIGDFTGVTVDGLPLVSGLYYLAVPDPDTGANRGKLTTDNTGQVFAIGRATDATTLHIENDRIRPRPDWPDLLPE